MSATNGKLVLKFHVPIRLKCGENNREHRMARAARVKTERQAVFLSTLGPIRALLAALNQTFGALPSGVVVTLTRVSPGSGLDSHDNLRGACKAVVDELASILGVDDRDSRLTWQYEQERGEWGFWVHIVAQLAGPVVVERPKPPPKPKKRQPAPPAGRSPMHLNPQPAYIPPRSRP